MTDTLLHPPRVTARPALATATLGSLAVLVLSVVALVVPSLDPRTGEWPGILEVIAPVPAGAAVSLGAGIAGTVLGVLSFLLPTVERWSRPAAVLVVVALAAGMPGGSIALAGYLFAVAVPIGVVLALLLLVRSRQLLGTIGLLAAAAAAAAAVLLLDAERLVGRLVEAFAREALTIVGVAAVVLAIASWVLWLVLPRTGDRDAVSRLVLRHRRAITIVAAACALPYTIARASWLTPWPLFAPDASVVDEHPDLRLMGLLLGAAMLTGGILTLGLISRWGERFPGWMAGLAGRPVPAALAVVPATSVAALFTFGGIDLVAVMAAGGGDAVSAVGALLVLPFWLWGPALALATWGYAMHRDGALPSDARTARAVG